MPPEPKFIEVVQARLPYGSTVRIDAVLKGGELRSTFLRVAVEAELKRREKAAAAPKRTA